MRSELDLSLAPQANHRVLVPVVLQSGPTAGINLKVPHVEHGALPALTQELEAAAPLERSPVLLVHLLRDTLPSPAAILRSVEDLRVVAVNRSGGRGDSGGQGGSRLVVAMTAVPFVVILAAVVVAARRSLLLQLFPRLLLVQVHLRQHRHVLLHLHAPLLKLGNLLVGLVVSRRVVHDGGGGRGGGVRSWVVLVLQGSVGILPAGDAEEVAGVGDEVGRVADERASDEEHDVLGVHRGHLLDLLQGHATTRRGYDRGHGTQSLRAPLLDVDALLLAEPEPAPEGGEDGRVGAGQSGNDAKENLVRETTALVLRAAAEHRTEDGRVAHDGQTKVRVLGEVPHGVDAGDARDHEHRARAGSLGEPGALDHQVRGGVQARGVDALATRLGVSPSHSRGAGPDALLVGRVSLVGQAVIVLDDVDATLGKRVSHLRELRHAGSHGLERGHEHRALRHAQELTQTLRAEPGPEELAHQRGRQLEILHLDVLLDRGVAENHVEELRQLAAGGIIGVPHHSLPPDVLLILTLELRLLRASPEGLALAHDVLVDPGSRRHERLGQLHGLLQAQRFYDVPRALFIRRGYLVGDPKVRHGRCGTPRFNGASISARRRARKKPSVKPAVENRSEGSRLPKREVTPSQSDTTRRLLISQPLKSMCLSATPILIKVAILIVRAVVGVLGPSTARSKRPHVRVRIPSAALRARFGGAAQLIRV